MNSIKRRLSEIRAALGSVRDRGDLSVLLVSGRLEFFDLEEFEAPLGDRIGRVAAVSHERELRRLNERFDIALVCSSLAEGNANLAIRQRELAGLVCNWTFDNHHHEIANLRASQLADVIIPGHAFARDYLLSPFHLMGPHMPLPTSQWSRARTRRVVEETLGVPRLDALYGGFFLYKIGVERNRLLTTLAQELPNHALVLRSSNDRSSWFSRTPDERLREWTGYKVSLNVPVNQDLPIRVFDSLIAGQIPLVPERCLDLDRVVPTAIQESLPIIRFKDYTVEAVEAAWRAALARFDADGAEGVLRRHSFAREHHHLGPRLAGIVDCLAGLASQQVRLVTAPSGAFGLTV